MLSVIYTKPADKLDGKDFIYKGDVYFDNTFNEAWLKDKLVQDAIADIDKSVVKDSYLIVSPVLGMISPFMLSGGAKTVILMRMDTSKVFNGTSCGDNCAPWIQKIGEQQDLTIRLGHFMRFVEPFEIKVLNSGKIVKTYKDLYAEYRELVFNGVI